MEETEPATTKRRGKSLEQRQEDANKQYSVVQSKLNSVLSSSDPELAETIHHLLNRCASNVSRVVFEAYLLANVHVLRLIKHSIPLPELNQSFFKSCCVLVSATTRGVSDNELSATMDEYRRLRPVEWVPPFNEYMSTLMGSASREMATAAENHIVLNFPARLVRYVRIKYNLESKWEAEHFIRGAFMDSVLTDDQRELKDWLVHNPCFEDVIKKHKSHFLVKLFDILKFF